MDGAFHLREIQNFRLSLQFRFQHILGTQSENLHPSTTSHLENLT